MTIIVSPQDEQQSSPFIFLTPGWPLGVIQYHWRSDQMRALGGSGTGTHGSLISRSRPDHDRPLPCLSSRPSPCRECRRPGARRQTSTPGWNPGGTGDVDKGRSLIFPSFRGLPPSPSCSAACSSTVTRRFPLAMPAVALLPHLSRRAFSAAPSFARAASSAIAVCPAARDDGDGALSCSTTQG